jgi:hypothetical protein
LKKPWPPHMKKPCPPHLKSDDPDFNEKAHLLIAIPINTTFAFSHHFSMTFVSSPGGFSTT